MLNHRFALPEGILILDPESPLEAAEFLALGRQIDPCIAPHGKSAGCRGHRAAIPRHVSTNDSEPRLGHGLQRRRHSAGGRSALCVGSVAKGPFKNNLFNFFAVEQSYNSSLHEMHAASSGHGPSPRRSP